MRALGELRQLDRLEAALLLGLDGKQADVSGLDRIGSVIAMASELISRIWLSAGVVAAGDPSRCGVRARRPSPRQSAAPEQLMGSECPVVAG